MYHLRVLLHWDSNDKHRLIKSLKLNWDLTMQRLYRKLTMFGLLCIFSTFGLLARAGDEDTDSHVSLKNLRKIYLVIHPLYWVDFPEDDPRHDQEHAQQFPGRWELSRGLEFKLQQKYHEVIRQAKQDEGMFFLPTREKSCGELLELARQHFGPRLAALEDDKGYKFDRDMSHIRKLIGTDLAQTLEESFNKDRQSATENRGEGWEQGLEWMCWEWSKTWTVFLRKKLEDQGYTFDPATVEFEAMGENWSGCCATYPINMGRAWGLAQPISRRFDLINPDGTPILLKAELVEQNLPMPGNIRLFIFKTADEAPTWGSYVAQFYEGIHGVMDRPRMVEVNFPANSVNEITGYGTSKESGLGVWTRHYGRIEMSVGYGGHFYYPATLVMTIPEKKLPLEDFRDSLLAGKVKVLPKGTHP